MFLKNKQIIMWKQIKNRQKLLLYENRLAFWKKKEEEEEEEGVYVI